MLLCTDCTTVVVVVVVVVCDLQGRPTEASMGGTKKVSEFGALETAEMVPGAEVRGNSLALYRSKLL